MKFWSVAALAAAAVGMAVRSAAAEDWPHWRGPRRNDHSGERSGWTGRGKWLPERAAWSKRVGEGGSAPIIAKGRLYAMGFAGGKDYVFCLDADSGREIWQVSYASSRFGRHALGDQGLYAGPCSTPEYDSESGYLYTLGIDGDLHCWDGNDRGRKIWHVNLYDRFQVPQRPRVGRSGHRDYGFTTSPLIQGGQLIVEVGGKAGTLIGFDKKSGEPLWHSEAKDLPGHTGGPAPIVVEGRRCAAVLTFDHLLVAHTEGPDAGRTVARFPWKTEFANNIASAAVHRNNVLVTSGYNHQAICRLRITLGGAEQVWKQPFTSKICTPVVHRGHVYFAWRQLRCLDFETGQQRWAGGKWGDAGSLIATADDRLIVWGDRGTLALVETAGRSPQKYVELEKRERLFASDVWPHVVLSGGRLYLKDRRGGLLCFVLGAGNGKSPDDGR